MEIIKRFFSLMPLPTLLRHLFFGALMGLFFYQIAHPKFEEIPLLLYVLINTILYPYSRYVYESAVDFITGNNQFIVNAVLMLFTKLITISFCWCAAILIAPIGILILIVKSGVTSERLQ